MTVPARLEAAHQLLSLDPPAWLLRHSCAVGDVAAWLAARAAGNGHPVDVDLVATAALLHDVDKLPATRVPAHLRHGDGSAAWLAAHGWPELGPLVRDHPVTRLAEGTYASWAAGASLEVRIVAYADKRAGQRLESLDARFASWRRRYPTGPSDVNATGPQGTGWTDDLFRIVTQRARALEQDVCAVAGVRPGDVQRLRWSRRVLREAAS